MTQHLHCTIFYHCEKDPNVKEWEPKMPAEGDRLRQTQIWGWHRALVGLTSVEEVTQSRSRERMAQVWPLTSGEVITRTQSSVVILYLNLNPGCLGLCGPDTDSCMKVAEFFSTLQKLEVATETRLLGSVAGSEVLLKQKAGLNSWSTISSNGWNAWYWLTVLNIFHCCCQGRPQ